jgi:hypothetical protein
MADPTVNETLKAEDEEIVVPLGIVGAAAEGGMGGAYGAGDIIASADTPDGSLEAPIDKTLPPVEGKAPTIGDAEGNLAANSTAKIPPSPTHHKEFQLRRHGQSPRRHGAHGENRRNHR